MPPAPPKRSTHRFPKRRRRGGWLIVLLLCGLVIAWLYTQKNSDDSGLGDGAVIETTPKPPEIMVGAGSAEFSIYAPQYPGSTVVEASRFADTEGTMMIASITTPDNVSDVTEFYRRALADKGFKPKLRGKGQEAFIAGERASAGISVLVTVKPIPNNGTRIDLTDTTRLGRPAPDTTF